MAVSILAAAALSACGTETIDAGDLEQELAEQLSPRAGVDPADVSVECPEDQEGGFEAEVPPEQFR